MYTYRIRRTIVKGKCGAGDSAPPGRKCVGKKKEKEKRLIYDPEIFSDRAEESRRRKIRGLTIIFWDSVESAAGGEGREMARNRLQCQVTETRFLSRFPHQPIFRLLKMPPPLKKQDFLYPKSIPKRKKRKKIIRPTLLSLRTV